MTKAVFFDIDGTLLSYRTHTILENTTAALRVLQSKGIKLFISSGRPKVLIPPMPVEFDGYITVNGGYCTVGDTILLDVPICHEDCDRWLDYVKSANRTTMCFTEHDMFINRIDPVALKLREQLGFDMPPVHPIEELYGLEVYQFIALQPESDDTATQALLPHCRMPRWHSIFTDIIPNNISKASGIEKILSHFGIDRSEAMAFGDGSNDIEMLDYVGVSVAMGNAADIVKQHASFVTFDSDNDGISHALQHYNLI